MDEHDQVDETTAERSIGGQPAPDDAPAGGRALAVAFDDARRPLEEDELAGRANLAVGATG